MSECARTPRWVWIVIASLALTDPAVHFWTALKPPTGLAPTGLHIFDDIALRIAMRMFDTGFNNPFAVAGAPQGPHSVAYFAVPWYWLYGAIGSLATWIHLPHYLMLGLANGACLALYLYTGWRFLLVAAPRYARTAFALWALGGGIGGALYLALWLTGGLYAPVTAQILPRAVMYDLIEGGNPLPILNAQRLYYTFPLALGLWALTTTLRNAPARVNGRLAGAALLLFSASLLNLRLAPPLMLGAGAYLLCATDIPAAQRWKSAATLFGSAIAGALSSLFLLAQSPSFAENAVATVSAAAWLFPLVVALFFHVIPAVSEAARFSGVSRGLARVVVCALNGYLIAFALLYLAYQLYWGNAPGSGEASVAPAISDVAVFGALLGIAWSWKRRLSPTLTSGPFDDLGWAVLWALGVVALSISAFDRGAYLVLVPQRFIVLLSLPLSVLSAAWLSRRPRLGGVYATAFLGVGGLSIIVGALMVQGPLLHSPGRGPLADHHAEYMRAADQVLIQALEPGIVLAPMTTGPCMGDVIALRPKTRSVLGVGGIDFGDYERRREAYGEARAFFAPHTDIALRARVLRTFGVNYVYCPATSPVPLETMQELRAWEALELVAATEDGATFRVASNLGEAP